MRSSEWNEGAALGAKLLGSMEGFERTFAPQHRLRSHNSAWQAINFTHSSCRRRDQTLRNRTAQWNSDPENQEIFAPGTKSEIGDYD